MDMGGSRSKQKTTIQSVKLAIILFFGLVWFVSKNFQTNKPTTSLLVSSDNQRQLVGCLRAWQSGCEIKKKDNSYARKPQLLLMVFQFHSSIDRQSFSPLASSELHN
ncbi:hypothetical protein T4B_3963 [Trichinella pseudospiralis]|uniref:Uncharacterized protein n=1 Tax=Trichinella pseudospiralis TaxID=6337 RepID=A0A0V1HV00_TRIPS|nr:hypothetical protein T4B_3963 [Trichinella pseudospiralis]